MKKLMTTVLIALIGVAAAVPAIAAQPANSGKVRLDPQNLTRASQVVARNKGLFQDPVKLETLIRLSKTMQQKRALK